MFSAIAKCFSRLKNKDSREVKILLLGLDNAGKSTIINDLKGEPKEPTIPTVGFSSADFKLLNFKVTAYDVGGGPRIRGIWKDYYAEIFGMVYVVDASDHDRIADSRTILREALSDSRLAGKPFIVFANKQDIDGSLSEQDIELQFELEQFAKKCESHYKVFQCTALLNGGEKVDSQLKKGLNWLLQTMKDDFASLKERIQREVAVQKEAERKERAERRERVLRRREERERAEREKEAARNNENDDSDDDDVVFGNVLPRVTNVSKTKKDKSEAESRIVEEEENDDETVKEIQSSKSHIGLNSNRISEEPLAENSEKPSETGNQPEPKKKKRKKKKKAKRNQTAPSDEGENNETGIVLKPIAWKTPPASLNGFPGNGRKLEPIRPPLHNNLYSPSNLSLVSDGEESDNKFSNGHIGRLARRPNEEDCDVIT